MAENSKIEWTDHTFNPVVGCQKVSPGCDHCYAESWAKRSGLVEWGPGAERRRTSEANWRKPIRWDKAARETGRVDKVFCASLADVFDNQWPAGVRDNLWAMIRETPNLHWMLLTKRIGNVLDMLPPDWDDGYPNVRLMISLVNQEEADRDIPKLLSIRCHHNGVSYEPALGPVDFTRWLTDFETDNNGPIYPGLDWVIVGGESGPNARPFNLAWARSVVAQCKAAGTPAFVKQLGSNPRELGDHIEGTPFSAVPALRLKDKKGGDISEWPADLRVREFPS